MRRGKENYEEITTGSTKHTCIACLHRIQVEEQRDSLTREFNIGKTCQNKIRENFRYGEGGGTQATRFKHTKVVCLFVCFSHCRTDTEYKGEYQQGRDQKEEQIGFVLGLVFCSFTLTQH